MVSTDLEKQHSDEQIEARPVASGSTIDKKPGLGAKVKRHCARFWWLHIIIFCVVFLIIALCLVYVGMPKIAQHDVDAASLEFTDLQFLDPTPDSITLTQRSILHNPSVYTPTLDPFDASLYVVTDGVDATERIMVIGLPEIHATKPRSYPEITGQVIKVDSIDQLTDFATQVLHKEEVETVLKGKTKLHLGKLPTVNVNYNSATKYKGLNGLQGFNVTNQIVNLAALPGTPNLSGFAYIPNPSVMTIAMGNVTLTLSTEKQGVVGNSTINDMTLRPGNNTLPMTGIVDQAALLKSLGDDGFVDLLITGKDAIYNGEHLVYYEKALASNVLHLKLNVQQILADSAAAAAADRASAKAGKST